MIIGIVGYAGDGKTLLSVIYTTHLIYGNPDYLYYFVLHFEISYSYSHVPYCQSYYNSH